MTQHNVAWEDGMFFLLTLAALKGHLTESTVKALTTANANSLPNKVKYK